MILHLFTNVWSVDVFFAITQFSTGIHRIRSTFHSQYDGNVHFIEAGGSDWVYGLIVHVLSTAQVKLKNVKIGNQVDTESIGSLFHVQVLVMSCISYIYKFLKDSVGPTTEMGQWPTSATSPKMWLRHSWHIDLIYTYTLHRCQHFAQVVEECQDGSCRAILDTGTSLSQPFQRRRCRYSCHLVKDWMVRMQTKKSLFKSMFRDSLSFHSFFQSLVSFKEVPQMQDPNSSCYIVFQRACVVNVPLIDSHRGWEFPDRQQGIMSWFYLILFG